MKKEIGIRLKECRKNVNMTQREVAKILAMTQQQYSRFENGIYELNYDQIVKLCQLFGVSSDYILGIKEY
jgi:transcriptional regulator with XRE-family HTH domain